MEKIIGTVPGKCRKKREKARLTLNNNPEISWHMKKSRRTYNGVHLNKKSNTQDVVEQSLTIILSQANIETHSRMRSSMILKDSVFRKEQRTHTISPERLTFLSLPCNPPQNQHCRINRMKARTCFLFPIPFPLLLQYHVLPFSFHILEYFSKYAEDRKTAWYFRFSPDRQ